MAALKSIHELPGPRGLPVLGSLPTLAREPVPFFMNLSRKYGELIPIRLGLSTALLLNRPEQVEHVLQRHHRNYRKTRLMKKLQPMLGTGLLTSGGDLWASQRRLMQPAFHRHKIEAIAETMQRVIAQRTWNWQRAAHSGAPLNVARDMAATTLEVAVTTMFGADIGPRIEEAIECIEVLQVETPKRVFALTPLREWLPSPAQRRFREAVRTLDEIVYGIIRRRRESGAERDDLLSLLMAARDAETDRAMTDRQLRDEVMTMFAAGHETTSNAMTWMFSLFSEHSDVCRLVRNEIDTACGSGEPGATDLSQLAYTTAVINEALRLYPPIWWTSRVSIAPDEISGYRVPKNTIVLICPWTIQRHPDIWEEPDTFRPARFLPGNERGRHKFAFFPFGAGPRVCIGSGFAMMEMKLILAAILPRFTFKRCGAVEVEPGPYLTLKPRDGLPMRIRQRPPAAAAMESAA